MFTRIKTQCFLFMFKYILLNIKKSFTYNCSIIYRLIDLLVLVYDLLNKIKFKLNNKKYK